MSDTTPLEAEATAETVEFKHFDRTWRVPAQQRLSHMRKLRRDPSNLGIVDAFLDAEQIDALDEINPTDVELDQFTSAIAEAMGYGGAGNS